MSWELSERLVAHARTRSYGSEQIKTVRVTYHDKTPVKNVGTDPQRWQGTEAFADALNNLKISKWMKTVVEPQEGYVPPPLEGIWARYPYFHNNAVPNLCALFTPPSKRRKTFIQGYSDDPETDYTQECVGYPIGKDIPKEWHEEKDAFFDTRRHGLSNSGDYKCGSMTKEMRSILGKKRWRYRIFENSINPYLIRCVHLTCAWRQCCTFHSDF